MVWATRKRSIVTEEDAVTAALEDQGMKDLEEMSLEEKKQLLQALQDSKEQSQDPNDAPGSSHDVSSTTLEKKNADSIVVQIEDSLDGDEEELTLISSKRAQSSQEPASSQPMESYNENDDDDIVESSQPGTQAAPGCKVPENFWARMLTISDIIQNRTLMSINVLNHEEPNVDMPEFYHERLMKLKRGKSCKSHRIPWYFDKKLGMSKDAHYTSVLKEMDGLAALGAKRKLQRLHNSWNDNEDYVEAEEEPVYDVLPFGEVPKEVSYKDVQAHNEKESESGNESAKSSQSSPSKVVVSPKVVDLEENDEKSFPGPSTRSRSSATKTKETDNEPEIIEDSNNLVECPLCSHNFDKSVIESHFDLCEKSMPDAVGDCCPLCNIVLEECVKEKHMEKCREKNLFNKPTQTQVSGRHSPSLWSKANPAKSPSSADSDDSDEEPPLKKFCD